MNGDKINGRTPEEIKKGMEYCNGDQFLCERCSYNKYLGFGCTKLRNKDALALIQQLERDKDELVNETYSRSL